MNENNIGNNVKKILTEIPTNVILLAAVKGRSISQIESAVAAGIKVIGENYVQEAEKIYPFLGKRVQWHFIGHLQKNKVKRAVTLFDVIQTVDSVEIAERIDYYAEETGKIMPVFVEINSGREKQKSGVFPEDAIAIIREIHIMKNLRIYGLMTMGPAVDNPEDIRPYYRETAWLFKQIKELNLNNVEMKYLSMGMSDTYKIAIEEGANIIRLGDRIFGGSLS